MRRMVITKDDAGQRLDRFLLKFLPGLPVSIVCKWLRKGSIRVNGRRRKGDSHLQCGDLLILNIPERFFPTGEREDHSPVLIGLPTILYEDGVMLVLDKPAGLAVHPGSGIGRTHLVAIVLQYLDSRTSEGQPLAPVARALTYRPSPVHRLDRSTSGIIVFSKTAAAHRTMADDLRQKRWRKTYYGVVAGEIEPPAGRIDLPLQRKEGQTDRTDEAITNYRTLRTDNGMSLLELVPETGRFRQIRRHLAATGFPLIGDRRCGTRQSVDQASQPKFAKASRLLLHAGKLVLPHPVSREELSLVSELPFDLYHASRAFSSYLKNPAP